MSRTLTVYTSEYDGFLYQGDDVYLSAHNADIGVVYRVLDYFYIGQYKGGAQYEVYRGIVYFDTSSLPSNAVIESAVLSLWLENKYISAGYDFDVVVQSGQPTYPHSPAVVGDYLYTHYSGDGGSENSANFETGVYTEITLNSDGRDMIQKGTGAVTKLCLRSSRDIASASPALGKSEYLKIYTREYASAAKLYITYTAVGDYPTEAITRVTGIRHVYRPGSYRAEVVMGDVTTELKIPGSAYPSESWWTGPTEYFWEAYRKGELSWQQEVPVIPDMWTTPAGIVVQPTEPGVPRVPAGARLTPYVPLPGMWIPRETMEELQKGLFTELGVTRGLWKEPERTFVDMVKDWWKTVTPVGQTFIDYVKDIIKGVRK